MIKSFVSAIDTYVFVPEFVIFLMLIISGAVFASLVWLILVYLMEKYCNFDENKQK